MPVQTIQVRKVSSRMVRVGYQKFSQKFDVLTTDGEALETWSALVASLCQRAHETGRAVRVQTKQTRYGFDIVDAEYVADETPWAV